MSWWWLLLQMYLASRSEQKTRRFFSKIRCTVPESEGTNYNTEQLEPETRRISFHRFGLKNGERKLPPPKKEPKNWFRTWESESESQNPNLNQNKTKPESNQPTNLEQKKNLIQFTQTLKKFKRDEKFEPKANKSWTWNENPNTNPKNITSKTSSR